MIRCALMAFVLVVSCSAADGAWPGTAKKQGAHTRHDFTVDGRKAWVVVPQHPAPGHPWVWRARFPGYHPEADNILLDRGFHIAFIDTNGMLGSPRAMKHWDKFYAFATERGLAKKPALEGVSRGGLFVYGFASRWPQRVACIYADTPVCDFKSWPLGRGKGKGHDATWKTLLKEYGFTHNEALAYEGNPVEIATLTPIAKAKIPLLTVVSLNDVIVPPTENTFVLAERYRELGGSIDIIEVTEGTTKSNGHHFTHPDPVRVADFIERHAAAPPQDVSNDYFVMRGSLDNSRIKFERGKVGTVAFMGGSITQNPGWRDMTKAYLTQRFSQTKFTFIDAGISSTGSVPGAFRLDAHVLSKGTIDLFFEEAAVNDLHNGRSDMQKTRGMEGIVRHMREANPNADVVMMHFVDPNHMANYRKGKTPSVIARHESVAERYGVSTIQLAREVTERIDAEQFTWKDDFKNLHPSPYGQRLYAATIRRFLSTAWATPLTDDAKIKPHRLPGAIDAFSYDGGRFAPFTAAGERNGFSVIDKCDPRVGGVGGGVRGGFVSVPMLVGTKPGDAFEMSFTGRGVGLFVAAGPDAGTIEYRVDDGKWQKRDLFTKWSRGLHLPWVYVLADELDGGKHTLTVRIAKEKHTNSKGHAVRIVHLLVNE